MNLGILGAGKIAQTMARTILMMNEAGETRVKLYAVAARDLSRAEEFAQDFSVEKAYGSYEEMLSDKDLELVYIATPHSHHYQHMKLCADYGKHILCEKAFTVTAEQAEAVVAYGREKGVLITEAIWTRYQPMRRIIDEALASGVIGAPRMLSANLAYVTIQNPRIVLPELAGEMAQETSVCAIVNLRRHARQLYDALQTACPEEEQDSLFFLTTDLCPAHRSAVIDTIRERLRQLRRR